MTIRHTAPFILFLLIIGCDLYEDFMVFPAYTYLYGASGSGGWVGRLVVETGETERVVDNVTTPYGVALDSERGRIYWSERTTGMIKRANRDGSRVEIILYPGTTTPADLVYDPRENRLFWCDYTNRAVFSCPADGGAPAVLLDSASGIIAPIGIALDEENRLLYFTDEGTNSLYRCALDGSDLTLILDGLASPHGIDFYGNRLYWTSWTSPDGALLSADSDGTDLSVLATGLDYGLGVSFCRDGYLYYSQNGEIRRCLPDGSEDSPVGTAPDVAFLEAERIVFTTPGAPLYP